MAPKPSLGYQNQGPSRRAPRATRASSRPGEPADTRRRACSPASSLGVEAPELAGVGEVEALAHGRPQPGPEGLGEGVGPGPPGPGGGGVDGHPGRERRRQPPGQVGRAQREPDPAALQVDAAVAGPALEVVAEQAAQVAEDAGVDRRVQPVAAVVDPDPVQLEAGRGPAGPGGPLEHHHPVPGPGRPVGGADPGRPGTEDDQVGRVSDGLRHAEMLPAGRGRTNLDKVLSM